MKSVPVVILLPAALRPRYNADFSPSDHTTAAPRDGTGPSWLAPAPEAAVDNVRRPTTAACYPRRARGRTAFSPNLRPSGEMQHWDGAALRSRPRYTLCAAHMLRQTPPPLGHSCTHPAMVGAATTRRLVPTFNLCARHRRYCRSPNNIIRRLDLGGPPPPASIDRGRSPTIDSLYLDPTRIIY